MRKFVKLDIIFESFPSRRRVTARELASWWLPVE